MRTIEIFEVGETVLIKAKVSQVFIDKDRVTYALKDGINSIPYQNRYSMKDILPYNGSEDEESEDQEKRV